MPARAALAASAFAIAVPRRLREHGRSCARRIATRRRHARRATLARGRNRLERRVAEGRLVERVRRPATRRADGRSARGQPHAEDRRRAHAQGARRRGREQRRAAAADRRERVQHARALFRERHRAPADRRKHAHTRPAPGDARRGRSTSGARTVLRTKPRSARRAPPKSMRTRRGSRCRRTSRRRTCNCSARTCSATSPKRR